MYGFPGFVQSNICRMQPCIPRQYPLHNMPICCSIVVPKSWAREYKLYNNSNKKKNPYQALPYVVTV